MTEPTSLPWAGLEIDRVGSMYILIGQNRNRHRGTVNFAKS